MSKKNQHVVSAMTRADLELFPWQPEYVRQLDERGWIGSRVQFGDGYAQVSYRGLIRIWDVRFQDPFNADLREIQSWMARRSEFLWKQPGPCEADGAHPTRWTSRLYSETNGVPTIISYEFVVSLGGPKFVELASQRYGPRDTGMVR